MELCFHLIAKNSVIPLEIGLGQSVWVTELCYHADVQLMVSSRFSEHSSFPVEVSDDVLPA
jgi:hypothetical protein